MMMETTPPAAPRPERHPHPNPVVQRLRAVQAKRAALTPKEREVRRVLHLKAAIRERLDRRAQVRARFQAAVAQGLIATRAGDDDQLDAVVQTLLDLKAEQAALGPERPLRGL